jgi:hypothetical protein
VLVYQTNNQLHALIQDRLKFWFPEQSTSPAETAEAAGADGQAQPKKDKIEFSSPTELYDVRIVNIKIERCAKCRSASCVGCFLPRDDEPISLTMKMSLLICWRKDVSPWVKEQSNKRAVHQSANLQKEEGVKAGISVYDCIRAFTKPEKLGKDDAWFCSKCGDFRQATKKFDLWKLPEIMIIHLKRFQVSGVRRDKISTVVNYPVSGLDLSPFALDPSDTQPVYDLYAISVCFH